MRRFIIQKLKSFFYFLLRAIQLQLFLTLCSLPFVLSWGIPLSYASILGNIIFAPFLSLFLFIAFCMFMCELLGIPYSFFAMALELVTQAWSYLLSLSNRSWLCYFAQPSWEILLLILIATLLIVHSTFLLAPLRKICALFTLLLVSAYLITMQSTLPPISTIACFEKKLFVFCDQRFTILFDPGILGRRISAPSFVSYTLIPELIKKGIGRIDAVICAQPSTMVFRALITLVEGFPVSHVYLPCWQGCMKNSGWSAWESLLNTARYYGTSIYTLSDHCSFPHLGKTITFLAAQKNTKKNGLCYRRIVLNN